MPQMKRNKDQIAEDIATQTKVCCVCNTRKTFDEFYNLKNKSDGKSYRCKDCDDVARKKWKSNNHERAYHSTRNNNLKTKYGIDIEWYNKKFEEQGCKCAVCGVDKNSITGKNRHLNFAVDHNHVTGKVRGVLCNKCNRAIGMLGDSSEALRQAAAYLTEYDD